MTTASAAGRLKSEGLPVHRFANILVCSRTGSPTPAALRRLDDLAAKSGASIELMDVIEPFPWYTRLMLPRSKELQHLQAEHEAARLDAFAAAMKRKEHKVATKVASGRPGLELIKEVLRGRYDLLVKVAEPDHATSFGSTDMRLLRNCPCPVLILHPETQEKAFQKILVAVDPTPEPDILDELHLREEIPPEAHALNHTLVRLATALAEMEGAELHLVHAWSAPGEDLLRVEGRVAHTEVDTYVASLWDEHRRAMDRLLAECPIGQARRHVHLIKGQPADVLTEFARTNGVDLMVMGTVVRTGIPGLLIGNTAETVFHRVKCSILAVKPETFVSPVTLEG